MPILHWTIPLSLDDLNPSCTAVIGSRTRNNVELDLFPVRDSNCCDFTYGKDITGN